ncbi:SGNH/GDSL hydrolase family protein [Bernardetia sp. ABR2-2B]|uniref:SGNH/GDSL hydrolase family protein n=1 Tax=Bernardetia sp. ABR2-2B TaxID=3127472 RepID=UPI0030CD3779
MTLQTSYKNTKIILSAQKTILIGFTFLFILSLFSCKPSQKTTSKSSDTSSINPDSKVTYLALGDSYTIGESVKIRERYPIQLAERIEFLSKNNENEQRIYFEEPKIIAKTGWTCEELLTAIRLEEQKNELKQKYDIVSLLIGVNDQYDKEDSLKYEGRFEKLLQKAISLAGKKASNVFVISIPDYGMTDYAKSKKMDEQKISQEIDYYNRINKKIALKYKVTYFDITPISRKAISDKSLIAKDGLHPSAEMYKEWVELMADDVLSIIKN